MASIQRQQDALSLKLQAPSTIERQTKSKSELVFYAFMLIIFDVGKMITSYALKYYNHDTYPVKQTLIVFLTEDAKLVIMIGFVLYTKSYKEISLSVKFAIPSVLYALNNNLYLYAFHFTTPAVWNILTQSRIIITALIYRLVFKKHVTKVQWLSLAVLAFAISLTQMPGGSNTVFIKPAAFPIAAMCSFFSVAAGIFIEYSFKNDKRSFVEQQLQLCLFAALASLLLYRVEAAAAVETTLQPRFIAGSSSAGELLLALLVCCVMLGAVSGLITGVVIKKLDNIVKIYSQSLCGVLNAIACMLIFPSKFSPNALYFISLLLVVGSIFTYERYGAASPRQQEEDDDEGEQKSSRCHSAV